MTIALPDPKELISLVGVPGWLGEHLQPLHDQNADSGLFGPGSITWKVFREPFLVAGGARALLMQAAHPLVAQGALDHSAMMHDPFGRLYRTAEWTVTMAFGTIAEVHDACRKVHRMHRSVTGTLPSVNGTATVPGGTQYRAQDADLARWVHATLVQSLIATYEACVGTLSIQEKDQFVCEWNAVARLMGIPRSGTWYSWKELCQYIDTELGPTGRAHVSEGSRQIASSILSPSFVPKLLKPAWAGLTYLSVGLLPDELKREYGIMWTPAHRLLWNAVLAQHRLARKLTPRTLRTTGLYSYASKRSRGDLLHNERVHRTLAS